MRVIFADSFYWIALANPADQWHRAAKEFTKANKDALVTNQEVLTEFLNYFAGSGERTRGIVAEMCERTINHPKISVLPQTSASFLAGLRLYQARPDKGYSLTDCISMAAMRERQITDVLTHDDHFRQEGFNVVL